ncbi:MAG: hypothetical protein AAB631_02910 [Patescibacteria group bacterium]
MTEPRHAYEKYLREYKLIVNWDNGTKDIILFKIMSDGSAIRKSQREIRRLRQGKKRIAVTPIRIIKGAILDCMTEERVVRRWNY